MYALATETAQPSAPTLYAAGGQPEIPYCFVLDDDYRVVMAGPANAIDPFGSLYGDDAAPDALPGPIDRAVRAMTSSWRSTRNAGSNAAVVSGFRVIVAPLNGESGRRIAVFVERNY